MRRGLLLLVLGVLATLVGVASARAGGIGTTGTTTTTDTTTTTTTTTPSYSPLATSVLPAGCVGAGAAAVVPPSHSAVVVGTPASDLGPSAYPASASVVAFGSSSVSGSGCTSARITLTSVSLFQGAVTASSVAATGGRGTVSGLAIEGTAVSAAPGQTLAVGSWGQLTIGERFGRVAAPLVLTLLQGHGPLGAGTRVAVAFSATARPVVTPRKKHQKAKSGSTQPTLHLSQRYAKGSSTGQTRRRHAAKALDLPGNQPYPFLAGGGGLAPAARHDPIVSIAMRYLGIPYQWGGASPSTGFDCSGLVQYVFAKVGVSLVHYAASQYDYPGAVWVSPKRLQPGDLVFFVGSDGTRKAPGHVGIYVDDGYFIDAPHTGSFVRIDSLADPKFANQYIAAKRIVGAPLHVRRLAHATDPSTSAASFPVGFPTMTLEPLGEPLGVASALPAEPRGYWLWIGAGLGGLLLLLGSGAGAFLLRRRRVPDTAAS